MLIVTDKAAQYLCETLTRKPEGSPEALRIVYTAEEGYHLTLDDTKEGDQVFEQDGHNYLFLDALVGEALSDATLDVQDHRYSCYVVDVLNGAFQCLQPFQSLRFVESKVGLVGADQVSRSVNDGFIEGEDGVWVSRHLGREAVGTWVQSHA